MHPPTPLIELWSRHHGLAAIGALNMAAAAICLLLMQVDDTTVLGVNRWNKPAKFGFSVGIYLWTIAWFLPSLRIGRGTISSIGWTITTLMFFENLLSSPRRSAERDPTSTSTRRWTAGSSAGWEFSSCSTP